MDPRLLKHYNRELQHVREMGAEFAREFPKIAGRLGMDGIECADPYVERLLEGFAFLTARVQLKLDAQYPVFTQHLLEMVYPNFLSPLPSMAVVQLTPDWRDAGLVSGHTVARHTPMRGQLGAEERTACQYRTAHEVTLWPIELAEAKYLDSPAALAAAGIAIPAGTAARAGLRLRFRMQGSVPVHDMRLDTLPIFLAGGESAMRLYEQLLGNLVSYQVRGGDVVSAWLPASGVEPLGFEDSQSLLPSDARGFSGYRLLQEYFACPQRFLFANVTGLRKSLMRVDGQEFDIVFLFDRSVTSLHNAVSADNFRLFCTPAINLFPRRADRIHLDPGQTEHHVVVDRTRPVDYEIHSIRSVDGYGDSQEPEQHFEPFYGGDARTWHNPHAAYYSVRREPRLLSVRQRRKGARSSYTGSELFISLVDCHDVSHPSRLRQLGLDVLCSNRDLPLQMPVGKGQSDFQMDGGAPVSCIRCVAGPTRPRPATDGGESAWKLVSHLQLNYLSLFEREDGEGVNALREMLGLYCDAHDAGAQRQLEGIKSVLARPIVRRIPVAGPIMFGRGLEVTLTCEETAFEGGAAYLLAAVLRQFFARYVSINAFTETVLRTVERNEVARWPATPGTVAVL